MCRISSLLVTEAERKHVRRRPRFQFNRDASCHQVFFPARQVAEGNSRHSDRNTGEYAPSYVTVKNWVVQFKRDDFSTCVLPRPGRHKTVTTPQIIDRIHELILEDRRISTKSIAEQLGISRGWVGSSIQERFGHAEDLREVGPEIPERGSKTSTVTVV